ncbi:hypothetical protein SLEP1_g7926 [Rubroshorea leprosula]|uniref:Reverse transcriptase zinc-binding domain-containing protein n=1 Tax=Rubroshorea leprosula TaxID=152421 RepID=A0AAV5I5Z5_9ROSI|nr:hypothetical protein SLEP1_g7926 [Rubroshorea leprosula]
MGVEVEDDWKERMAYKLCCKEEEFPFKYLGIPIGGNHRKLAMWQPLVDSFKRKLASWKGKKKDCYQLGTEYNGTWKWNLTWRKTLFQWEEDAAMEIYRTIEDVKISPGRLDKWEWIHSKDGQYSTTTAYSVLTKERRGLDGAKIFKRVWNPIFPSKIATFNWKVVLDRIPMKLNLFKRGIIKDMREGKCTLCEVQDEDTNHLFLNCKIARWLWSACARWWGITITIDNDCWKTFENFGAWSKDPRTIEGWDCI